MQSTSDLSPVWCVQQTANPLRLSNRGLRVKIEVFYIPVWQTGRLDVIEELSYALKQEVTVV